jgi:hypothetical protein
LTRRDSEERHRAVLKYFLTNPSATGDEAQKALTSGALTGKSGPPMGIGMLFRLKRQSEALRRDDPKEAARIVSEGSARYDTPVDGDDAAVALRSLVKQVQQILATMPSVAEVRVTKAGAKVLRTVTHEEEL